MASSLISVISKKIVKPSIPTPLSLKSYNLSFPGKILDMFTPFAFFYPGNTDGKSYEPTHIAGILEKSLSKALSFYYPYAGRLMKDGSSIDCNDMGVELSHVRVHCSISEILKSPYTDVEHVVFLVSQPFKHHAEYLAVAQVSYFDCGGIAIGGCLSHKIGDACTSSNFFYDWGILSRHASHTPSPHFVGESSIYQQSTDSPFVSTIKPKEPEGYIGKRFNFRAAEINALKKLLSVDSQFQNPVTRTEALSALIYKCALAAAKTTNFGSCTQSLLFNNINMRKRVNPPLSQNAAGNIVSTFAVRTSNNEISCPKLVSEMKKQKEKFNFTKNKVISPVVEDSINVMAVLDKDNYSCSSLLGFPLYKTDFGWGNPARVSYATGPRNNYFILMDNQCGDRVEAIVILNKQEMALFEKDPELLEFAVPVP